MPSEMLINITPRETRVALVENGVLQDIEIEREHGIGWAGNIYKGKVVRVLPGMQAAFVDIGLERAGFIHNSELICGDEAKPIEQRLHDGQMLVVQVIKDPMGKKGARLSMKLSIPSRYLVFMPGSQYIGVSQRIESEEERARLKGIVKECLEQLNVEGVAGYILRTAAEHTGEAELHCDIEYFGRLWCKLTERIARPNHIGLIYEELPLSLRSLRDTYHADIRRVQVDSQETYHKIQQFIEQYIPNAKDALSYYQGPAPLFDLYSVEDDISRALERKVMLKSGGYIVIDQTEAMTTVDVNTGSFVGKKNQQDTIYKTNLEAVSVITRQLRLRNLGGIIIVDFIDMESSEHQRQVLRMLEKSLEKDPAKTNMSGVSALGLVELTRQRTRESLEHILMEPCQACGGLGAIKTAETMCYEIGRNILREDRAYSAGQYLVLANEAVVSRFLEEERDSLADLETFIGKSITLRAEPNYLQHQYDIILQ